jgi:MFS family permease
MPITAEASSPTGREPPNKMVGPLLVIMPCLPMAGILLIAQVLPSIQAAFASTPHVAELTPIALTIPALTQAITAFGSGWLADKFGRTRLLLVSLAFYGVTGMAPLFLNDLHAIVLDRAIMGVMEGGLMAASTALIADYYSAQTRARMLSLQTSLASGTAILVALLGGFLGDHSWRTPFMFYAIGLVIFVLCALFIRDLPPTSRPAHHAAAPRLKMPWGKIWFPCAFSAVVALGMYVPQIESPFILTNVGISTPHIIGAVTALGNAGIMLGTLIFLNLVHLDTPGRTGLVNLLILTVLTIGLTIIGTASNGWIIALGSFIASIAGGIGLPCMLNRTIRVLDMSQYGRGVSLCQAIFAVSGFATPLVVLALAHVTGTLSLGVCALAVITLVLGGLQLGRRVLGPSK